MDAGSLAVQVVDNETLPRIRAAATGITILQANDNGIAVSLQIEH